MVIILILSDPNQTLLIFLKNILGKAPFYEKFSLLDSNYKHVFGLRHETFTDKAQLYYYLLTSLNLKTVIFTSQENKIISYTTVYVYIITVGCRRCRLGKSPTVAEMSRSLDASFRRHLKVLVEISVVGFEVNAVLEGQKQVCFTLMYKS